MRHICLAVLLAVCVAAAGLIVATAAQAQSSSGLPSGPCDEEHILDIEIINGVLYECSCEQRIFVDPDCEWQEITSQAHDPHHAPAKKLKRIKAKPHRRHVVIRYALPAVTR